MKLRRIILLVMTAVLMVVITACGKKSDFKTEQDDFNNGVRITEYTGTDKDVVAIPEEINGEKVVSISVGAFERHSEIKCIEIPKSVVYIDSSMFSGCTSLTDINVAITNPNLHSIDGIVYFGDTCLVCPIGKKGDVTVPDRVREIGFEAFNNCTGVTSVTLPDSITVIGISAFNNCTGLTSITFGNGLRRLRDNAFGGCASLMEVTLPDRDFKIEGKPFSRCYRTKITYKGNTYDYEHLEDLYDLLKES